MQSQAKRLILHVIKKGFCMEYIELRKFIIGTNRANLYKFLRENNIKIKQTRTKEGVRINIANKAWLQKVIARVEAKMAKEHIKSQSLEEILQGLTNALHDLEQGGATC